MFTAYAVNSFMKHNALIVEACRQNRSFVTKRPHLLNAYTASTEVGSL